MKTQFKIQLGVVILLLMAFMLVSLVSCAQPAPDCGAVRAHIIDSLKQVYEELKANDLDFTDTGVEAKERLDIVMSARAEVPKTLPTINKSNEVGEIKVKDTIFMVYQGSKGGYYYNKVSGKTGLTYKKYLSAAEKAQFTGGN